MGRRWQNRQSRKQQSLSDSSEIKLLNSWIDAEKPDRGSNPLALPSPPPNTFAGPLPGGGGFTPYAGCKYFDQLPISRHTKRSLRPKYTAMSDIQRASIPHALCGRDILGAAKTGSGKTLAFIIPVIEKLYRKNWCSEDGVGCIIISPTIDLALQLFEELKEVGKSHNLSAGLVIGGRKDIAAEKECINLLNILVCTPGRLLQHMDETLNFECSKLQVLVLDEADRILDAGFKKEVDAIVSQLPKERQTLLFSATQTKSVKDLARLSLKDPEYISVHAESVTATPEQLKQIAMEVPLDQKLSMLWSFIKSHLKSKILVFFTTVKQVKFAFEVFRKLRPGTPVKHLHGRMKPNVRMATYLEFCRNASVLFATDVAARGLDFSDVDWVLQVDCPEDVATYIHRVGRTARFTSKGDSLLFLMPSEMEMLNKLQAAEPKIPIKLTKANKQKILQPISASLSSLLVRFSFLLPLAEGAFKTYLRSIVKKGDHDVFDVQKVPVEEFAASLGLPATPRLRFLDKMKRSKGTSKTSPVLEKEHNNRLEFLHHPKPSMQADDILQNRPNLELEESKENSGLMSSKNLKRKKLKINLRKPFGTSLKYDDDGNIIHHLATIADEKIENGAVESEKVGQWRAMLRQKMQEEDKVDKVQDRVRLRDKRIQQKAKEKRPRESMADSSDESSEAENTRRRKNQRVHFDGHQEAKSTTKDVSVAEQEELALQLLKSMHS